MQTHKTSDQKSGYLQVGQQIKWDWDGHVYRMPDDNLSVS